MEKSSNLFGHFFRPYLAAEKIEVLEEAGILKLHDGGRSLDIEFAGDPQLVTGLFQELKNPASEAWKEVVGDTGSGLSQQVALLDKYGWIQDDRAELTKTVEQEKQSAGQIVTDATACLNRLTDGYPVERKDKLRVQMGVVLRRCLELTDQCEKGIRSQGGIHQLTAGFTGNIGAMTLGLLLQSWQRTSPATLYLLADALNTTENSMRGDFDGLNALSGLEDIKAIRDQVWTACSLIAASMEESRPQYTFLPAGNMEPDSGINTIVQAEAYAELLMSRLGDSPLLREIETGTYAKRCGANVFLHQYFVTIRYLDSILSFLRYRMKEKVRNVGFAYLFEEVGHDVHEKEACLHLGLSEEEIDTFSPLPYMQAYVELLGYFAEVSPIAFCLSVLVAEGMPGQKKMITDALATQGIDDPDIAVHTELDMNLNHSYFPREFMKNLPWIGAREREIAFENFMFVLEVSQLGWSQIARYSSNPALPIAPMSFSDHF